MSNTVPPFAALRAFDAIGRKGGIRKAAADLGISHAIVSRHLTSLEQQLRVQLFNRHSGELTETGKRYFQRVNSAILDIQLATSELAGRSASTLVIWSSSGFALLWLTRRLPTFTSGKNRPFIDLRSTDVEPVLERGEADGDIRYWPDGGPSPTGRDLRVVELARPLVFPVAAPGFVHELKNHIGNVTDLMQCPLIQEGGPAEWTAWFTAQGVEAQYVLPAPVARYGQAHLTVAAAKAGQGIALSNSFLVAEDLANGRLERVQPADTPLRDVSIGAYHFRSSSLPNRNPFLSRFEQWLRSAVAEQVGAEP